MGVVGHKYMKGGGIGCIRCCRICSYVGVNKGGESWARSFLVLWNFRFR